MSSAKREIYSMRCDIPGVQPGPWIPCKAATFKGARREATRRYFSLPRQSMIMVGVGEGQSVLPAAAKMVRSTGWTIERFARDWK